MELLLGPKNIFSDAFFVDCYGKLVNVVHKITKILDLFSKSIKNRVFVKEYCAHKVVFGLSTGCKLLHVSRNGPLE